MGLRIQNNIAALNSYNSVNRTDKAVSSSLAKLSSGYRINKAADDAAGLVVSEGLRSQIGGLTQASRNAQDGVNVAQTADGALSESTSILQRMRDLAVQAANSGSQDTNAQGAADSEFQQLSKELDRISSTTSFGNQKLLDGSYNGSFQIGAFNTSNDRININLQSAVFGNPTAAVPGTSSVFTASAVEGAHAVGDKITVGDGTNSVTVTLTAGTTDAATLATQLGTDGGAAFTSKFAATATGGGKLVLTEATVGNRPSISVATVTAANVPGSIAGTTVAGTENTPASATGFTSLGLGLSTSSLTSAGNAQTAIASVDAALKGISTARASIGAIQNRFEHAINNLSVSIENITASESAIRDTDMAAEMTKFTKNQVLSQAGTSMLAQANSSSQNILTLLRG